MMSVHNWKPDVARLTDLSSVPTEGGPGGVSDPQVLGRGGVSERTEVTKDSDYKHWHANGLAGEAILCAPFLCAIRFARSRFGR